MEKEYVHVRIKTVQELLDEFPEEISEEFRDESAQYIEEHLDDDLIDEGPTFTADMVRETCGNTYIVERKYLYDSKSTINLAGWSYCKAWLVYPERGLEITSTLIKTLIHEV